MAVNADGLSTRPKSRNACQWCLVGVIDRMSNAKAFKVASYVHAAVAQLYPNRYGGSLITFNDHPDTTFRDVQKVLKLADTLMHKEKTFS